MCGGGGARIYARVCLRLCVEPTVLPYFTRIFVPSDVASFKIPAKLAAPCLLTFCFLAALRGLDVAFRFFVLLVVRVSRRNADDCLLFGLAV